MTDLAADGLTLQPVAGSPRLRADSDGRSQVLHPHWLRERSEEPDAIDQGNKQRLFAPADLPPDLHATDVRPAAGATIVVWSDGHTQSVDHAMLARELGWANDPNSPPGRKSWVGQLDPFPHFSLPAADDDDVMRAILEAFWIHGFAILTDTATEAGSLDGIASQFGEIRDTNFGRLFDVFSKPDPIDLAYTPIELKAHTDNPYRAPVPGIQFLHCLVNDSSGGESTLVDGLAAFEEMGELDPEGRDVLACTPVTFRYEFGTERMQARASIFETDAAGGFVGIRNSDRLDFVDPVDPDTLDVFYRARRTLRTLLDQPERRAQFLLEPGHVMMMDNRRLLHGRTAYSLTEGHRHLQGCYIDHDGPDQGWRAIAARSRS